MTNSLTWLHISDLHFCEPKTGWDAARILETLQADLQKMEREHELKPDFIFFTGDVAFGQVSNEPGCSLVDQYNGAASLFDRIRTSFTNEVTKQNFFIIPGNHDVNRQWISDDQTNWLDKSSTDQVTHLIQTKNIQWIRYLERLQDYRNFLVNNGYHHLLADPSRLIYSVNRDVHNVKIGIAGFNSAWSCGRNQEKGKLWMAGHWQLENLLRTISSADIKIALVHHPANWLVEYEDSEWRRGVERDFDFCLHGHEHQEWVEQVSSHTRIAAGACYDDSKSKNGYNFVRLDLAQGTGEVWLRRYDNRGGGWIPDAIANRTNNDGIWPLRNLRQIRRDQIEISTVDIETVLPSVPYQHQTALQPLTSLSDPPPVIGTWVGRTNELDSLASMSSGVVVVTGIGGQGKSTLVAKFLDEIRKDSPNHFWDWRDCREQSESFHTQLVALINHFSGGELTGENLSGSETKDVIRYFFQRYADRAGIFVLDNVDRYVNVDQQEFTLGVAAFVNEALKVKHSFLIILTCRPRVVYASTRFLELHLPGLSLPEAVELFHGRGIKMDAQRLNGQINEIWNRTEGHPFWLELIATQMEKNPSKASDIVKELRKGQVDDRALAMFKALWKGLQPHQHIVLRCMAEMKHPETRDSIKSFTVGLISVPKHFTKAFNGLQSLSLIVERKSGTAESRYDLHPLIKSYLNRQFSSNQDRKGFIQPIIHFIDKIIEGLSEPTQHSPLHVIERWSYKAELELEKEEPVSALKTLNSTSDQLVARGLHEELFRIGTLIFEEIDWNNPQIQELDSFHKLISILIFRLAEHNREKEARSYLKKYEEVIPIGTVDFIQFCDTACHLEWILGNFTEAIYWGEKGLEIQSTSHIDTQHNTLNNLALSLRDDGQLDRALELFAPEQSIQDIINSDHRAAGKDASFYGNVGRCLQLKEKTKEALSCFVKSADLLYEDNSSYSISNRGYASLWIGEILEKMGHIDDAYSFYANATNIWTKITPLMVHFPIEKINHIQSRVTPSWLNLSEHAIETHCRVWIKDHLQS